MNDILDIEIILARKKYPKIYNIGIIITIVVLIFIYVIFTYNYQTYYISKGRVLDNKLELLVLTDDIKHINSNHLIKLDNVIYKYTISEIKPDLYIDDNYQNYQYVYLKISNLNNINNYVYEVKIPKERQTIAKYLYEYL